MAHQQKYYKDIEANGHLWRLEIWQDIPVNEENGEPTHILTPVEIGPVLQSLRLVVQGDQADIDTPIVKTSLEMSFVDAPGLEYERKCGYWEEFYTSSATEYQVKLYKDNILEWTGYVTPDSFAEDLRYRGSVNIIARDNLGTLQDTTCDLSLLQNIDGKVSINTIIASALDLCSCRLVLNRGESFPIATDVEGEYESSSDLLNQMVDVSYCSTMNWWEALENILGSIGAALRYIGKNTLTLSPMRDIPKAGREWWWDVPVKSVRFRAYGHRELVPGVKSIREEHTFDVDTETPSETVIDYVNDTVEKSCSNIVLVGPDGTSWSDTMPVWGFRNLRTFAVKWAADSPLLDVSRYERVTGEDSEAYGAWDDKSIIYYGVNLGAGTEYPIEFRKGVFSASAKIKISLTAAKPVTLSTDGKVLNLPLIKAPEYSGLNMYYRIRHEATDGTIRYYDTVNSSWGTSATNNAFSLSNSLLVTDRPELNERSVELTPPAVGVLILEIRRISTNVLDAHLRRPCRGVYLRLRDIKIEAKLSEDIKLLEKRILTTEYSSRYAVRLNRSPKFAINPTIQPEVAYVQNAILTKMAAQYAGADRWIWAKDADIPGVKEQGISLVRLIHQQLLAYYSKPNNLLTGEIVTEDPTFDSLYEWGGKLHVLTSGTLNVLTGRMESATLREFTRYDHMWETWVENEDVVVDYTASPITFLVHSNEALDHTAWAEDIPEWIFLSSDGYNEEKGVYEFRCNVLANTTGLNRVARFKIDTAWVRITQRAAGDYGIDYGEDYS